MGLILKFIPFDTSFEPETVAILGTASDKQLLPSTMSDSLKSSERPSQCAS